MAGLKREKAYIAITNPSDGQVVRRECAIEGFVSGLKTKVRVLTRPSSDGLWYVQNIPIINTEGRWQTLGYFDVKLGGIHEIAAIATNKPLKAGDKLKTFPEDAIASDVVSVTRKQMTLSREIMGIIGIILTILGIIITIILTLLWGR